MSDSERTLQILKNAGERGIHSFDLNRQVGTTRSAARILDLKKRGYIITSKTEKLGDSMGCRYFLNQRPVVNTPSKNSKPIRWEFDDERGVAVPIYEG